MCKMKRHSVSENIKVIVPEEDPGLGSFWAILKEKPNNNSIHFSKEVKCFMDEEAKHFCKAK